MPLMTDIGSGSASDIVLTEILTRAGKPTTPPAGDWSLASKVVELYYEPKNKPFLVVDPTLPEGAQTWLDAEANTAKTARWLIVDFSPCHDPRYADAQAPVIGGCYGCKTDNIADFGKIYASTTWPIGCVEGIVSSLANWKLYALALKHHEWTNEFITVPVDTLFAHPLRPDEQVQAGTVIHTMYCFQHVLAWYRVLRMQLGATPGIMYRMMVAKERIDRAIPIVSTIRESTTTEGFQLLSGMIEWAQTLLAAE